MNECDGAVTALFDARRFGKLICNLPRHPDIGVPAKLLELPSSLEVWKSLERSRQNLANQNELHAYWMMRHSDKTEVNVEEIDELEGVNTAAVVKPTLRDQAWKSESHMVASPYNMVTTDLLARVVAAVPEIPAQGRHYIKTVLIARGATKAITIREAQQKYLRVLEGVLTDAGQLMTELEAPSPEAHKATFLHVTKRKFRNATKGIIHALSEMLRWLQRISVITRGEDCMFVSGSTGAAAFVPQGFADILRPYRSQVSKYRAVMLSELTLTGRPRSMTSGKESNFRTCNCCKQQYSRLWVHRGVCFLCEDVIRSEGRCPYNVRCGSRSFCPHSRCCFVCDQVSCEECRLFHGDGEDVWQLVGHLRPDVVFLDFDRTLATTKSGASPLSGNHSVDPDLAGVCASHEQVHIVTRSSRKADIHEFLSTKGVKVYCVHSVKVDGWQNKAEVINAVLATLPPESMALFVDDDICELTHLGLLPLVKQHRLHRLLFVRAGGKS